MATSSTMDSASVAGIVDDLCAMMRREDMNTLADILLSGPAGDGRSRVSDIARKTGGQSDMAFLSVVLQSWVDRASNPTTRQLFDALVKVGAQYAGYFQFLLEDDVPESPSSQRHYDDFPIEAEDVKKKMVTLHKRMEEAMRRGGPTSVFLFHVAVLGAARTGKSSLIKSLLRELHDPDEDSTPGMKILSAASSVDSTGFWCKIDRAVLDKALDQLLVCSILKRGDDDVTDEAQLPSAIPSPAIAAPDPGPAADPSPTSPHGVPREPTPKKRKLPQDEPMQDGVPDIATIISDVLTRDYARVVAEAEDERGYGVINLYDLGGQQIYQSAQPLLTSPNTTFVVTFDASKDLEGKMDKDVYETNGRSVYMTMSSLNTGERRLDNLLSWLDNLVMRRPSQQTPYHDDNSGDADNADADADDADDADDDDNDADDDDDNDDGGDNESSGNRALLVGCKNDERLKAGRECPTRVIDAAVRECRYSDVIHSHIYYVDNTKSGKDGVTEDSEVIALRDELTRQCKQQKEIPVLWLRFTIGTCNIKAQNPSPWMSLKDATELAMGLGCVQREEDVESLLLYQHTMGHLAYFPTAQLQCNVILDVQFVMDAICAVIHADLALDSVRDGSSRPPGDDMKYCRMGFLTTTVAKFLLREKFHSRPAQQQFIEEEENFNYLFKLLEELSVLCKVPPRKATKQGVTRRFLIPAAVREDAASLQPASGDHLSGGVCIKVRGLGHMPPFLYWQAVVEMLKYLRSRRSQDIFKTKMALDGVRLPWSRDDGMWLRLRHCKLGLEVRMENKSGKTDALEEIGGGAEVLGTVLDCLKRVTEKRGLAAGWVTCVPCPCRAPAAECFKHGRVCDADPGCFHLADSTKMGTVPSCCYCDEPQDVRHASRYWLALDQDSGKKLVVPACASTADGASCPRATADAAPSSQFFADVTDSGKMLSAISDLEEFGDAVGNALSSKMQAALAKELVKRKGGVVNNYRTIVKDWIKHNDKGTAELSNVSGQLFYFVEKKDMSCGEFLLMLRSLFSPAVAMTVATNMADTEFK